MSADANKPKEGEQPPVKKKGLPPVILVAVGAALGGAGVVFLAPKPQPAGQGVHKEPEYETVQCADKMSFLFNPKSDSGNKQARISLYFVVKQRKDKHEEDKVNGLIKANWERAKSRVLEVLMSQTVPQLRSAEGKQHLRKMVIDELTLTFFLRGEAQVVDILWEDYMFY